MASTFSFGQTEGVKSSSTTRSQFGFTAVTSVATASSTLPAALSAFSRNLLPRETSRTLTGCGSRLTMDAWLSAAKSSWTVIRTLNTPSRGCVARKTTGVVFVGGIVNDLVSSN